MCRVDVDTDVMCRVDVDTDMMCRVDVDTDMCRVDVDRCDVSDGC